MRDTCGKRVQNNLQPIFESRRRKLRTGNAKRVRVTYPLDDSFEGNLRGSQIFSLRAFRFEGIDLARECTVRTGSCMNKSSTFAACRP